MIDCAHIHKYRKGVILPLARTRSQDAEYFDLVYDYLSERNVSGRLPRHCIPAELRDTPTSRRLALTVSSFDSSLECMIRVSLHQPATEPLNCSFSRSATATKNPDILS